MHILESAYLIQIIQELLGSDVALEPQLASKAYRNGSRRFNYYPGYDWLDCADNHGSRGPGFRFSLAGLQKTSG